MDRPGGDATTAVAASLGAKGVQLSISPGRIDPNNIAFFESRKPLAGEFMYNSNKVIVVNNHLSSKSGDTPLLGRYQPPDLYSEPPRILQAQVVNDFVDSILALDASAKVIVLGDLNDFQFSTAVEDTLEADVLHNLLNDLPENERYTYVYQGNAQALDHIMVSDSLYPKVDDFDVVHVNAEFAYSSVRASDHDPVWIALQLERFYWHSVYVPFVEHSD
ncbi:endonuclease/exonuclease/phosphatase family protein [Chloroflexota bacterium]